MNAVDQAWLESFVREHNGMAGTVHRVGEDDLLALTAAVGIPPPVLAIIDRIPRGKGMAGLAYERNEPISTCNIQTDATGNVRPGAKMVGAQAGITFPIHDNAGTVRAVVGIAYREERTLLESEVLRLQTAASKLP